MMYPDAIQAQAQEARGPGFAPNPAPFDDNGWYTGQHKPGMTYRNCGHGHFGCHACEREKREEARARR